MIVEIESLPRDKEGDFDYSALCFDLSTEKVFTQPAKGEVNLGKDTHILALLPKDLSTHGAESLRASVAQSMHQMFSRAVSFYRRAKLMELDSALDAIESSLTAQVEHLPLWGSAEEWFEGAEEETIKELSRLRSKVAFEAFCSREVTDAFEEGEALSLDSVREVLISLMQAEVDGGKATKSLQRLLRLVNK